MAAMKQVKGAAAYCAIWLTLAGIAMQQSLPSFYSITGTGNNLKPERDDWGKVGAAFLRVYVKAAYDDSIPAARFAPSGANRPAARAISLSLTKNPDYPYPNKKLSSRNSTAMLTYYGQLVSHDLNKRKNVASATVADQISFGVTNADPWFSSNGVGRTKMNVTRSAYVMANNSREQTNGQTAYLDLSVIYTTNITVLNRTRAYVGGEMVMGGADRMDMPLLKSLDFSDDETKEYQSAYKTGMTETLRAAGDPRGNQNAGALALRTLYLRNHNRLAKQYAANCSDCSDESLFQAARRRNIAIAQAITFYEYVPQLGIQLTPYTGYKPDVNPGIDNFFSTVAYRYGHSEVTSTIWRLQNDGTEHPHGHVDIATAYFNPDVSLSAGIEPILRGLSLQLQGEVEPFFAEVVQQQLFGPASINSSDLVSINILRARDHGIPAYNDARLAMGLPKVLSWAQVTSNQAWQQLLAQIYPSGPDTCDPYICGLAEDKMSQSHFGPLFYLVMKEQYERLQDGDRLYFENNSTDPSTQGPGFTRDEINQLKVYGLRDLIMDNTNNMSLPADVWNTRGVGKAMAADTSISSAEVAAEVELKANEYYMSWKFGKGSKDIEISVRAKGEGWVGFGIPEGFRTFMVDADMYIGSQLDTTGRLGVEDYWSLTLGQKPITDVALGGEANFADGKVVREGGWTKMTFRRPVKAGDKFDRDITPDLPQWIIFAWHPANPILGQHFAQTRGQALINWRQGVVTQSRTVSKQAKDARRAHGTLMALAFVLLLPLGAQVARSLRYCFIANRKIKALCFYAHVMCQVTAVVLATIGFSVALSKFNKKYYDVPYGHGELGISVMFLLYAQLLLGFIRPPGSATGNLSVQRRVWDVVHSIFGPLVILLGIGNVVIGIYLFSSLGYGSFTPWAALCGTAVIALSWGMTIFDRMERLHLSKILAREDETASDVVDPNSPMKASLHLPTNGTGSTV